MHESALWKYGQKGPRELPPFPLSGGSCDLRCPKWGGKDLLGRLKQDPTDILRPGQQSGIWSAGGRVASEVIIATHQVINTQSFFWFWKLWSIRCTDILKIFDSVDNYASNHAPQPPHYPMASWVHSSSFTPLSHLIQSVSVDNHLYRRMIPNSSYPSPGLFFSFSPQSHSYSLWSTKYLILYGCHPTSSASTLPKQNLS